MKMLTEIEEAAALKLRFAKLKSEQGISRAAFAKDSGAFYSLVYISARWSHPVASAMSDFS